MSRSSLLDKLLVLLTWVVCLLLIYWAWREATGEGGVSITLLPAPDAVFKELGHILSTGAFIEPWEVTFYECVMAFSWAASVGLALGYVISRSTYLVQVFEPLLASLFTVQKGAIS